MMHKSSITKFPRLSLASLVKNFKYIHSVDSIEKLQKISNISREEKKNPLIMLQVKLSDDPTKGGFNPQFLILKWKEKASTNKMSVIINIRRYEYSNCLCLSFK